MSKLASAYARRKIKLEKPYNEDEEMSDIGDDEFLSGQGSDELSDVEQELFTPEAELLKKHLKRRMRE